MADNDPVPDPFAAFESDRTIVKPSGGRGRRSADGGALSPASPDGTNILPVSPHAATVPASAGSPGGWPGQAQPTDHSPTQHNAALDQAMADLPAFASLNPLVQIAAPLLTAAPRLRAMPRHSNPAALRASLVAAISRFEASARAHGLPNEQVVAGRYVLCTLLDESASSTPWGSSGAWSSQSLLVQFHNEAWGGEKVFQLLTRLLQNPGPQRNLLELIYVALSLGFEGRYRVLDNGRAQLDAVRERLAQVLRDGTGAVDTSLSSQWRGVAARAPRLRDGVAMWVVAAAAAAALMLVFVVLRLTLNEQTDATFNALQALQAPKPANAAAPVALPLPTAAAAPRLAQLLKPDIDAGVLQVQDLADRSVVTLRGDGLFEPGSADVADRALALFGRVAQALNQVPGAVLISGHTDNQPIRSLRFPSNWHLSKERAQSVRNVLLGAVKPERLQAEGRADTEPLADNRSAEGRSQNRRVVITLLVAAPG